MSPDILVVEDNLADAKLTSKLLGRCESVDPERVHIVDNGAAALEHLRARGPWNERRRPGLVFLDLNIPKISGLELLRTIRGDDQLKGVPVIVLSSSADHGDVERAYELHVNAYVRKPVDLVGFQDLMHSVERFWFRSCRLPRIAR